YSVTKLRLVSLHLVLFFTPDLLVHRPLHSLPTRRSSDLSSPVKRSIHPVRSRSSKQIRQRSICWLTSRQSSRPEKVPGMCGGPRSEEHTSELQSRFDLVCRLLLEKKKKSKVRNSQINTRN